jgi:SAM-dependent methyltransferase
MDNSMKIYWQLFFENFSNSMLIRQLNNPIREYENELVDGAIIDIGCGQSPFLLDFASTPKEIIAIDNEQFQLDYLKKRIENEDLAKLENWNFLLYNFPNDGLPDKKYSLMILSNILHFYSLNDCIEIGQLIAQKSSIGTLVYVGVHSDKFYANNPKDPNNNEYFKHYFTINDLEKVFPNHSFERVYYSEIDKVDPKIEHDLTCKWLDKSLEADGTTDPKIIEIIKKNYLKNKNQSDIITIFRRK